MTSLFDPMTSAPHSNSPTLDMLDGSLEAEKSSLHESKSSDPTQVSPEPETVTVTVSTVGDEHALVGQPSNSPFVADPNAIQFQYRTDNNGQVQGTGFDGGSQQIRVVHVQSADGVGDRVDGSGTTSFVSQPSQVQTVIQSPFSNGSSPTHHSDTDAVQDSNRFTYFQSQPDATGTGNVVQGGTGEPMDTNNTYAVRSIPVSLQQPPSPSQLSGTITMAEAQTITTVGTAAGGFYVMMSPQEVMQQSGTQRSIAPRTHQMGSKIEGTRGRDDKRRETHNEVERRRRDKINGWITKLAKVVPDCACDQTKAGQSKGGILAKTVDYINEIRTANSRMGENIKDNEQLAIDMELLRQQNEDLRQENAILRAQLQQHGIDHGTIVSIGQPPNQGNPSG